MTPPATSIASRAEPLLDLATAESIAEGLAAVAAPTAAPPTSGERTYELLVRTERFDAWRIHWPPGSGLDAHDHGGSIGAFVVVAGELDERRIRGDGSSARHLRTPQSGVAGVADDEVHAVHNRHTHTATSIHVYSPPLGSMAFYRDDGDGGLTVDRVEGVDGR